MAAKYSFVVLLALVVVAAAAEKKPSFADWLQASTSGAKKAGAMSASPSEYYGEVETVDACLRAVAKRNCYPAAGDSDSCGCSSYAEFGLTCCDPKHYYNKELNQYLNKPVEVGDCWIEETPIGNIHISDYVSKIAVFKAVCSMNEKSDECGHPFCDKMSMTIIGAKYNFSQAVVNNLPPALQMENTCAPEGMGGQRRRHAAPKAEIQSANSEYGYEYSHEKLWRATSAIVYHGTMTVNSRLHNIKFEDGTFQFVSDVDLPATPVPVHEAEAKDAYVLDPYKVELSFYKPKEY